MTDARILETIRERLAQLIDREMPELTLATDLREELGLNSLDAVDLVLDLEEAFGIELPDDDLDSFERIGDVVRAVKTQLESAPAS